MKKKLWLGIGLVVGVATLALPFALGSVQVQPGSGVTFSTSKTKDATASESNEKPLERQGASGSKAKPRTTEYRPLDEDHFKKNTNKQRLIFFKETGNETSDQVHALFSLHINEFKKDIIIYRADLQEFQELANQLAITRPGSVVKFDSNETIIAIYIAPERPQVDQLRQTLDI